MLLAAGARMKSIILEEANGPNLKTESPDDEEDDGYRKRETIMRAMQLQEFPSSSSCWLIVLIHCKNFISRSLLSAFWISALFAGLAD